MVDSVSETATPNDTQAPGAGGPRRRERHPRLDQGAAQPYLGLLYATATIANGSEWVETAARRIIERVCADTGWSVGRAYIRFGGRRRNNGHWLVVTSGGDPLPPGYSASDTLTAHGPAEGGLGFLALASGRARCLSELGSDPQFASGCAVPLRQDETVVGTLELFSPYPGAPDREELDAITEVGAQLGQVVGRVSEQRRALRQQQELAQTGRLASMRELARNLAHEVNQPLAAVVSYAGGALQLLEQGRADEQKMRRALEQVGVQAKRASGIIQEFREFLRREDPRHERLDVGKLVRDSAALVEARAREAGVTITIDLPPRLPAVEGDPVQLQQVLLNLMENGIEAMTPARVTRRELTISAEVGEQLELRLHDTGIGMPADLLPQLFTPFLTTKPHGLGMGLPVSRSVVEFHGGRLSGDNNPDGGMTFRIRLPLARRGE